MKASATKRTEPLPFVSELDAKRLRSLLSLIRGYLFRTWPAWSTLAEIRTAIGRGSEAGISARLRDLKKTQFGAHHVERQRRGDPKRGLHEYRVKPGAVVT